MSAPECCEKECRARVYGLSSAPFDHRARERNSEEGRMEARGREGKAAGRGRPYLTRPPTGCSNAILSGLMREVQVFLIYSGEPRKPRINDLYEFIETLCGGPHITFSPRPTNTLLALMEPCHAEPGGGRGRGGLCRVDHPLRLSPFPLSETLSLRQARPQGQQGGLSRLSNQPSQSG